MTVEEYERLVPILKKNGYRKWVTHLYNEDYCYCKGFAYYEDSDGDSRCGYQIILRVYDNRKYDIVPDNSKFTVMPTVMISGNHCINLVFGAYSFDLITIEEKAQSFYQWANRNFKDL